ncbi:hypothetical protein NDU88_009346 [Pleurodeles waltl]|uniref:Uncharacterized protein n=1 Tax=Pleurodeles waltl TaxID=8319 RepID=A0AAV7P6A7_PLEWA|nr:hypothetical protein NDU88_009346 [Pleurodeles waltl]
MIVDGRLKEELRVATGLRPGAETRAARGDVKVPATFSQDRDQELLYLLCKIIDLEDRSRRDNVRFLVFPENIEGADIHSYLKETLPKLTGLTFDPSWSLRERTDLAPSDEMKPTARPIIVCLLRHTPTRQLLQVARTIPDGRAGNPDYCCLLKRDQRA